MSNPLKISTRVLNAYDHNKLKLYSAEWMELHQDDWMANDRSGWADKVKEQRRKQALIDLEVDEAKAT